MPDLKTVCYEAMYVIGEVETRWTWGICDYSGLFGIGMMQWTGTRAAALLARVRDEQPNAYSQLDSSLRDLMTAHDVNDDFWNTLYLNQEQQNSIINVLNMQAVHTAQEEQAIEDFTTYASTLESYGFSINNPKPLIFAMSMWHQRPASAVQVISSCGGSADLDLIYTTCLNDGILGQYYDRYTTVFNRLKEWDGTSMPPDFGQNGDVGRGGNSGISEKQSQLGYIIQRGDNLYFYGRGDYENGVVFFAAGSQRWVNGFNANGTPITGGNTGGGSGNVPQVVALYESWEGQFSYSQGAGRLNLPDSGYSDCSGSIWCAYHIAAGIDVGSWTGDMVSKGTEIARGSGSDILPIDNMNAGDLILVEWGYENFAFNDNSSHVVMYAGNNVLYSHGGPGNGPVKYTDAKAYIASTGCWEVRRYA